MPESKDMPAGWALEEAAKRSGWYDSGLTDSAFEQSLLIAHARTIEKHEQPPVDPDVLAVREILAAWHGDSAGLAEKIKGGAYDKDYDFEAAVVIYRRVKNGGVS